MQKEEMIALLLCVVTTIQMVTPYGIFGKTNVESFITPIAGAESKPKCHVRNKWNAQEATLLMICYQCNDNQRSIIIYNDKYPVDAVNVKSCSPVDVAGSITVVPTETYKPKIEYDMVGKGCVCVSYDGRRRVTSCPVPRYIPKTKWPYYNGWRQLSKPWTTGVVRDIVSTYNADLRKHIMAWKYAKENIKMICYNYDADFVVKIFHNDEKIAMATVGTCRSPEVENSIDIVLPSKTSVEIQYKFYTDVCKHKTYTWNNGRVTIKGKNICTQQTKTICDMTQRICKQSKNGWKNANIKEDTEVGK